MRRIYESDAFHRGDDPQSPSEVSTDSPGPEITANQKRSLLPWGRLSAAVLPTRLRERAIAVSVETDRGLYGLGEPVHLRVRLRNRLPVPVTVATPTRRPWDWAVDGYARAAHEELEPAPRASAAFTFNRGETKTFRRTW